MDTTNEKLLAQLRSLTRVLMLGVACLLCLVAANVYYIIDDLRENKETRLGRTFYEQADGLAQEQSWDDVITLAQARQSSHPRDPNGPFFEGLARYYKAQYQQSVPLFEKAGELGRNNKWKQLARTWIDSARKWANSKQRPQPG